MAGSSSPRLSTTKKIGAGPHRLGLRSERVRRPTARAHATNSSCRLFSRARASAHSRALVCDPRDARRLSILRTRPRGSERWAGEVARGQGAQRARSHALGADWCWLPSKRQMPWRVTACSQLRENRSRRGRASARSLPPPAFCKGRHRRLACAASRTGGAHRGSSPNVRFVSMLSQKIVQLPQSDVPSILPLASPCKTQGHPSSFPESPNVDRRMRSRVPILVQWSRAWA
jgi:hypothetical protein